MAAYSRLLKSRQAESSGKSFKRIRFVLIPLGDLLPCAPLKVIEANNKRKVLNMNNIQNANDLAVAVITLTICGKAQTRGVKQVANEAAAEHNTEVGAIKANLDTLPPQLAKAVKSAEGKIRNFFNKEAIQFGKSVYAVPLARVAWFKNQVESLVNEYYTLVGRMVAAAQDGTLFEMIKARQGDLFDANKVPTSAEIEAAYGVELGWNINFASAKVDAALKILAEDIRSDLAAKVEETVKRENAARLAESQNVIRSEVAKLVTSILKFDKPADSLKGLHGKSVIDQLERVVQVLPAYNVTEDSTLSDLIEKCRVGFEKLTKDNIKEDETVRTAAIATAKEIEALF